MVSDDSSHKSSCQIYNNKNNNNNDNNKRKRFLDNFNYGYKSDAVMFSPAVPPTMALLDEKLGLV